VAKYAGVSTGSASLSKANVSRTGSRSVRGWRMGCDSAHIYQDLVADEQFSGGYRGVQRFVRGLHGSYSYYQRSTQLLFVPLRSLTIRPCNCDAIVKKLLSADPLTRACRFFGTATVPE